jgi:hypothetical protein
MDDQKSNDKVAHLLGLQHEYFSGRLRQAAKTLLANVLPSAIPVECVQMQCKSADNKLKLTFRTREECGTCVVIFKGNNGNARLCLNGSEVEVKARHDQPFKVRQMKWILSQAWQGVCEAMDDTKPVLSVDPGRRRLIMGNGGKAIPVFEVKRGTEDETDCTLVVTDKFVQANIIPLLKVQEIVREVNRKIGPARR